MISSACNLVLFGLRTTGPIFLIYYSDWDLVLICTEGPNVRNLPCQKLMILIWDDLWKSGERKFGISAIKNGISSWMVARTLLSLFCQKYQSSQRVKETVDNIQVNAKEDYEKMRLTQYSVMLHANRKLLDKMQIQSSSFSFLR